MSDYAEIRCSPGSEDVAARGVDGLHPALDEVVPRVLDKRRTTSEIFPRLAAITKPQAASAREQKTAFD